MPVHPTNTERCWELLSVDEVSRKLSSTMTFWAGCTKGSANQWLVQRHGIAGAIAYSIDVDKQRYQRGGEVDQAVLEVREGDLGRDGLRVLSRSHDASLQTSWAHQNYRGSRGSRGKGSDVALLGGASWLLDATPFPSRSRGSSHVPSVTSPSALTFGRRPRARRHRWRIQLSKGMWRCDAKTRNDASRPGGTVPLETQAEGARPLPLSPARQFVHHNHLVCAASSPPL